jgi:STE24 endopeptidase
MARLQILIPIMLWLTWAQQGGDAGWPGWLSAVVMIGGLLLPAAMLWALTRLSLRRAGSDDLHHRLRRLGLTHALCQTYTVGWFAACLFGAGWGNAVSGVLGDWVMSHLVLVQFIVGTGPLFLSWIGLWWAHWPAERAGREQHILARFDTDVPVHAPPSVGRYIGNQVRLQLLFSLTPMLSVFALRDLLGGLSHLLGGAASNVWVQTTLWLGPVLTVLLLSPVVLVRVLRTRPLPDSPLRAELEAFCRSVGLRYRDILLWETDHQMCNAAVMGLLPRARYLLLSDLLIESLTPRQIQGAFAHEVGHIRHRHMLWYALYILIIVLALEGPGEWVSLKLRTFTLPAWVPLDLLVSLGTIGGLLLLFGLLSRWCERQADMYAARAMSADPADPAVDELAREASPVVFPAGHWASAGVGTEMRVGSHQPATLSGRTDPRRRPVDRAGADALASTLHRVAVVNGMPLNTANRLSLSPLRLALWLMEQANHFFHGSIGSRMVYVLRAAEDPGRTWRFDRVMRAIYLVMTAALVTLSAYAVAAGLAAKV